MNGTKVGFIGLTSKFNNDEITVSDPIDALATVFQKVRSESDLVVLLFHSIESDIRKLHNLNLNIDLVLRSKAKTRSKDGGGKAIPVYSLGDRGKYLYQFDFIENEPGQPFIDRIAYENLIETSKKKLDRISAGNKDADLRKMYKDDPQTLSKINKSYSDMADSEIILDNIINEIVMVKHELGKSIDSSTEILQIIDIGKLQLEDLYGPIPDPQSFPHGHPNHRH